MTTLPYARFCTLTTAPLIYESGYLTRVVGSYYKFCREIQQNPDPRHLKTSISSFSHGATARFFVSERAFQRISCFCHGATDKNFKPKQSNLRKFQVTAPPRLEFLSQSERNQEFLCLPRRHGSCQHLQASSEPAAASIKFLPPRRAYMA